MVLRDADGTLRAMSNACRHRGTMSSRATGRRSASSAPTTLWHLQPYRQSPGTPYHGTIAIDKDRHCLPGYRVDTWGGLVFVCMSADAEPLADRLRGLAEN